MPPSQKSTFQQPYALEHSLEKQKKNVNIGMYIIKMDSGKERIAN